MASGSQPREKFRVSVVVVAALCLLAVMASTASSIQADDTGHGLGRTDYAPDHSCVGKVRITDINTDGNQAAAGTTVGIRVVFDVVNTGATWDNPFDITTTLNITADQWGSPPAAYLPDPNEGAVWYDGKGIYVDLEWPIPHDASGTYYVHVSIRDGLGNHCHSTTSGDNPFPVPSLTITSPSTTTDLSIDELTIHFPATIDPEYSDRFYVTFDAKNNGRSPTANYNVRFSFLTVDFPSFRVSSYAAPEVLQDSRSLGPGASRGTAYDPGVPDIDPGTYTICATISPDTGIEDSNPDNNVNCNSVQVLAELDASTIILPVAFEDDDSSKRFWLGKLLPGRSPASSSSLEDFEDVVNQAGLKGNNRADAYRSLALRLAMREELSEKSHDVVFDLGSIVESIDPALDIAGKAEKILDLYQIGTHAAESSGLKNFLTRSSHHWSHIFEKSGNALAVIDTAHAWGNVVAASGVYRHLAIEGGLDRLQQLKELPIRDEAWTEALGHVEMALANMAGDSEWNSFLAALEENKDEVMISTGALAWKFKGVLYKGALKVPGVAKGAGLAKGLLAKGVAVKGFSLKIAFHAGPKGWVVAVLILSIDRLVRTFIDINEKYENAGATYGAQRLYGLMYRSDLRGDEHELLTYTKFMIYDYAYKVVDSWTERWRDALTLDFSGSRDETLAIIGQRRQRALSEAQRSAWISQVYIDPSNDVTIGTGASLQLEVRAVTGSGKPGSLAEVSWSTRNNRVATVSETGLVTGVGVGKTLIALSGKRFSEEGVAFIQNVAVTVVRSAISVDTVGISPNSTSMRPGESTQLAAVITGDDGSVLTGRTVTWSSSSPGVASVANDGTVTGMSAGTATITATSEGVSGRATVTVTPASITIGSITVPRPPAPLVGVTERDALVGLFESTDGENWKNNTKWNTEDHIDDWRGVETQYTNRGPVTRLTLSQNKLRGEIPHHLGNLTGLESLNLRNNRLTGSIPPHLGNLSNLKNLKLYWNDLTGSIPAELGNLGNLKTLDLNGNADSDETVGLTGQIPGALGGMTNLTQLILDDNLLTGPIPGELGNLVNLEILYLFDNKLAGQIPAELGLLINLKELDIDENQLTGPIPPSLGQLKSVERIDLGENKLSGPIPTTLGNLKNLYKLDFKLNQLQGAIPTTLGDLESLISLDLGSNRITGQIPASLGNLENLTYLDIGNNNLSGTIPEDLKKLTNLSALYLGGNQLQGQIPASLGDLANLTRLDLSSN